MENFEKASRLKLRFISNKGELTIEDLWELSLPALDAIAKEVNKKLKDEEQESFIGKKSRSTTELSLRLDILKHVIGVKQEEAEKAKTRAEKASQVGFMKTLLEKKRLDAMESMSVEEIEKQLATLQEDVEA